jgi:hypothetical protein
MAKQEIFSDKRLAVAHGCTDKAEEKKQALEHCSDIMLLNVCSRPA